MKKTIRKAISVGRLKAPASVFTRCVACESPNITVRNGHVYCRYCDWDSVETYEQLAVEMFGFDLAKLDLEKFIPDFSQPQPA